MVVRVPTSQVRVASCFGCLPFELFHHYVLPDLLSEHIHQILVNGSKPNWHPFYTLPLVSSAFNASCKALCISIFGLLDGEGTEVIAEILEFAVVKWRQANEDIPCCAPGREDEITYLNLMSSKSLIQVYICAAIAESFFKADVLSPMKKNDQPDLAAAFDDEHEDFNPNYPAVVHGIQTRRYRMRDDQLHRLYRPFTCAMKLCDDIRPSSLAYIVADYLAKQVPLYGNVPMLLKNAQDLELYVARPYILKMKVWVQWTQNTFDLIEPEESKLLVNEMQDVGKMVQSFKRPSKMPPKMIKDTGIIESLYLVSKADWGMDTEEIQDEATSLMLEFVNLFKGGDECSHHSELYL